ncbi:MAG: hypothetical protein CML46_16745 [Rhodobacteraceae bacterium]|nr:hypothetical protein [Paracoccaceae bacterium]MBR28565.1 hypothetical protein [Paracoccaceae bacterium]
MSARTLRRVLRDEFGNPLSADLAAVAAERGRPAGDMLRDGLAAYEIGGRRVVRECDYLDYLEEIATRAEAEAADAGGAKHGA